VKFASALTTRSDWTEAVEELIRQIRREFGSAKTDLALLFAHPQFSPDIENLVEAIHKGVGSRHLVGCTGGGIIGGTSEIEQGQAISLLVAQLPDVTITPLHIKESDLEESTGPGFWHFQLEVEPKDNANFLLLMDPFSVQAIDLVRQFSEAYPSAPIIGGLASGGQQRGESKLFLDGKVIEEGAVGVALAGKISLRTVVSQGCRPIGQPLVVTRAEKNIVFELGGQPPMKVLQDLLPQLPTRDQQLARTALFLGRVINEYQEEYGRGDFLIRNLIGSDPQSGALAVGDWMRTGQTVQFQVRDGKTADEDLRHLLKEQKGKSAGDSPHGALLFSCLGRGAGMYGVPNHDIALVHEFFGPVPTAGFFCNGEIGPVGDHAFVHGFTSVIGLFSDPQG
jgi:small ligand-binding sensory domain FIST